MLAPLSAALSAVNATAAQDDRCWRTIYPDASTLPCDTRSGRSVGYSGSGPQGRSTHSSVTARVGAMRCSTSWPVPPPHSPSTGTECSGGGSTPRSTIGAGRPIDLLGGLPTQLIGNDLLSRVVVDHRRCAEEFDGFARDGTERRRDTNRCRVRRTDDAGDLRTTQRFTGVA